MLRIGALDNTWTQLYRQGALVYNVSTPDVLTCAQYRTFWLMWDDGLIQLAYNVSGAGRGGAGRGGAGRGGAGRGRQGSGRVVGQDRQGKAWQGWAQ